MLRSLHYKGYNPLAIVIPSVEELLQIIHIAGPVLLTLMSKVSNTPFFPTDYDLYANQGINQNLV